MKYTQPYGMIPSGVYHAEEYKDSTSFYALHLFPPSNAQDLYTEQVKRGVKLDKEHYLKRFPVWFSIFNGNTAIHLSTGKDVYKRQAASCLFMYSAETPGFTT